MADKRKEGRDELPTQEPLEEATQVVTLSGLGIGGKKPSLQKDRVTLTVLAGPQPGMILTMEGDEMVLGRGRESGSRIDDPGMSRRQARIYRTVEGFCLEDLQSTNGTFVNGEQISAPRLLKDGDRIQMGKNAIVQFALQDSFEQEAVRQLYESAVRDSLTRAYNRRYLDERLKGELAYALRHNSPLSLIILDVDHFKKVNDTLGHPAGDAVLRALAIAVQKILRAEDVLARYGGEEFAVVARGIGQPNATVLAERIRQTVMQMQVTWQEKALNVTVSVGVATMDDSHPYSGADTLLAAADGALYRAKHGGRNRVETA